MSDHSTQNNTQYCFDELRFSPQPAGLIMDIDQEFDKMIQDLNIQQ